MKNPVFKSITFLFLFIILSGFVTHAQCISEIGPVAGGGGCCGWTNEDGSVVSTCEELDFPPCCYSEYDLGHTGIYTQCTGNGADGFSCELLSSAEIAPDDLCGDSLPEDYRDIPCAQVDGETYECVGFDYYGGTVYRCAVPEEPTPCGNLVPYGGGCFPSNNNCCQVDPETGDTIIINGEEVTDVACVWGADPNDATALYDYRCLNNTPDPENCWYADDPGAPHTCGLTGEKLNCCYNEGEQIYMCDTSFVIPQCVLTNWIAGQCQDTSRGSCHPTQYDCCSGLSYHSCEDIDDGPGVDYRCVATECPPEADRFGEGQTCDPDLLLSCNGGCRDGLTCDPVTRTCYEIPDPANCWFRDEETEVPHYCFPGDPEGRLDCCEPAMELSYDYECDFSMERPECKVIPRSDDACQNYPFGDCIPSDYPCCDYMLYYGCLDIGTSGVDYKCVINTCPPEDDRFSVGGVCNPILEYCNGGCHENLICDEFSYTCKPKSMEDPLDYEKFLEFVKLTSTYIYFFGIAYGVVAFLRAGYLTMTSQGNPNKIADAKNIVDSAVRGMVFLLASATIIRLLLKVALGVDS